ncbi:hypothetical protein [Nostoc sp. NZL]|uniref:hypothetical protein n=1 Tax=Nostoc sp. NZL TaxID=2650612 RepID=UPI0018C5F02D|nr:hypothetical protein [Nostoc sp. NZL]
MSEDSWAILVSIFSTISFLSDGAVSPAVGDRLRRAEAKNAFKNLLVRNFRT